MNYVLSVINPYGANIMKKICEELNLPIVLSSPCKGTATRNMLDLLGMESRDRRLFMTVASPEQTKELIQEQRKRLYIDAPGNGVTIGVPIKSVGGAKTLSFLSNGQNVKGAPTLNYDYELILVIANQGATDQVMDAARSAGYKLEYLEGAGLAVRREDGTVVDKFRERVMFPIHSVSGRVVAYSGRTLHADNPAKYVNSPETEIYVKSRNLLGIYFAKSEISRLDKCILVEGNMDVVMMHQLGIRNVVASCGTSLTVEQLRLIRKFTENLTIMYDGDSAGIHAALRGTDIALAEGLNVRIILLPEGEDPDSFCKTHTLEQVQAYMEAHEQDFVSFKTDLLLNDASGDPLKKAELINDIADTVAEIPDAVKRSVYVESIALKFNIESSILFDRITRQRQRKIEESREAAFRDRRRREAEGAGAPAETEGPAAPAAFGTAPGNDGPLDWAETDRIVAPVERDILYFLLNYGSDVLNFESDSEYHREGEDNPTVTEFIAGTIDRDGGSLVNPAYQRVYAAYLEAYDEGHPQEEIVRMMLNSPDRQVSFVAAQLSIERYQLTVKSFEDSLTTKGSWLVSRVPKLMLMYMDKKLDSRQDAIRREMATPEGASRVEELLTEMLTLQRLQKTVKDKMNK